MDSAYRQTYPTESPVSSGDNVTNRDYGLLESVARVSREWLAHLAVSHPQRASVLRLELLAVTLISADKVSPLALTEVRKLICETCHRLNATNVQCTGYSLDRCQLLRASIPSLHRL
jgi:hypothetical protein